MVVPLHVRSEYSLGESCIRIQQLVNKATEFGYPALALTDHNTMAGVVTFYNLCRQYNIKPILGLDLDVKGFAGIKRLVLLAKNNLGYGNLLKLASCPKPVLKNQLKEYHQGIIGLVYFDDFEVALECYNQLLLIFGDDNLYVQLLPEDAKDTSKIHYLSRGFPPQSFVASQTICYLEPDEKDLIYILQNSKHNRNSEREIVVCGPLLKPATIAKEFLHLPQAINNARNIASRCSVDLFSETQLPKLPDSTDFRKQVIAGAKSRYTKLSQLIIERLEHEIAVIESMEFADYFMIVADIVSYAKRRNIPVGPGRGSAAGSLVAYCLYITEIDPLQHDLLFERFLNKQRRNFPDIDLDVCYLRRDEIIDYCISRFGREHVAKIGIYGSYGQAQAKNEVKNYLGNHRPTLVKKLIGLKQYFSTHAAGLVITPQPITNYSPVENLDGTYVTQLTMDALEQLGLLKIDILSLRNLTILDEVYKQVAKKCPGFRPEDIPRDDEATFQLLSKGETLGIFQLESKFYQDLLRQLRPQSFQDLVAVLALGRPGPLKQVPTYIRRRDGMEKTVYIHPKLELILKDTHGLMIYQEQVMQVAHEIAGFSLEEADLLRVAISAKNPQLIKKLRYKFIKGCKERGLPDYASKKLYWEIEQFAGYAFNKAHSVAYATITWQLAYFKTQHPIEFFLAHLKYLGTIDKTGDFYQECIDRNIRLLLPDVFYSEKEHVREGNSIRIGLASLRHIGEMLADTIISQRKQSRFTNLEDFFNRLSISNAAKYVLAYSGALDGFGQRDKIVQKLAGMQDEPAPNLNQLELMLKEQESIGVYLSAHPTDKWIKFLEQLKPSLGSYIAGHISEIFQSNQGLSGVISNLKGSYNYTLSKEHWHWRGFFHQGALLALFGKIGANSFKVESVLPLKPMVMLKPKMEQVEGLQKFLLRNSGTTPVIFTYGQGILQLIDTRFWLNVHKECLKELDEYTDFIQWIDPWEGGFRHD